MVKLRAYLLFLVIAIALPLVLFAALAVFLLRERQDQATERSLADTGRALAVAIDRQIDTSVSTLQALATSKHLEAGEFRRFYEDAERIRETHKGWLSIFLADARGPEILTLLAPLGTPLPNISGDADFIEAVRTRRPYVSDLLVGPVSGHLVMRVYFPVVLDGVLRYLLVAAIEPADFTRVLTSQTMSPRFLAMVIDRKGRIVARTRDADAWVGRPVSRALLEKISTGREGVFLAKTMGEGTDYFGFSRVPGLGFTVAVAVPRAAMATDWFWAIVAGTVVVLAGALTCALVIADRISGPMLALARMAVAFGRGEMPSDAPASPVEEVEAVRHALVEAAALAAERAREQEARAREQADRVAAEAARREAQAANQAKDQFIAMLGHELRTPLAAIGSAAYVISRLERPTEHRTRAAEIIERQVGHLRRLVDDLLDVSRAIAGKIVLHRRPVDLAEIVRKAIESFRAANRMTDHVVDLVTTPVWIDGDETRMEQVAANLVDNALKYTPPGGRITVRVLSRGEAAVLEVGDDGAGIPADVLPHIFDLFVQGRQQGNSGLGIGLTLVRRLVKLHGGTVHAASGGPGAGTVFTVRIPLTVSAPVGGPAMAAALGARGDARLDGVRILLVEDEPDSRELLQAVLADRGAEVTEAASMEDAQRCLLTRTPTVLVSDIGLPDGNGCDLVRWLRALETRTGRHRLPAIALTAYASANDSATTLDAGFDVHVAKPVELDRLASIVVETVTVARGARPGSEPAGDGVTA